MLPPSEVGYQFVAARRKSCPLKLEPLFKLSQHGQILCKHHGWQSTVHSLFNHRTITWAFKDILTMKWHLPSLMRAKLIFSSLQSCVRESTCIPPPCAYFISIPLSILSFYHCYIWVSRPWWAYAIHIDIHEFEKVRTFFFNLPSTHFNYGKLINFSWLAVWRDTSSPLQTDAEKYRIRCM